MNILVALTQDLPFGTNLALIQFFWMLVSGALRPQRGALFPALQATGLSPQATRRAWAAFRKGMWQTAVLLRLWQAQIEDLPGWQVHEHEGYRAVAVDVTAFWRPALRNCSSKHYHPAVLFTHIVTQGCLPTSHLTPALGMLLARYSRWYSTKHPHI